MAAARTADGRWVLIRRGDTGEWALPGGTLEWGETLRKGIGFAQRWGAGSVEFVNLYAYRATDPKDLPHADDPARYSERVLQFLAGVEADGLK